MVPWRSQAADLRPGSSWARSPPASTGLRPSGVTFALSGQSPRPGGGRAACLRMGQAPGRLEATSGDPGREAGPKRPAGVGKGGRVKLQRRWGAPAKGAPRECSDTPFPVSLPTQAPSSPKQTLGRNTQFSPLPPPWGRDPDTVPRQLGGTDVPTGIGDPPTRSSGHRCVDAHLGQSKALFTFFIRTFCHRAWTESNPRKRCTTFLCPGFLPGFHKWH